MAGDAQGVSDLLPRPALFPGRGDVVGFDPLSQAMERQRGAKPDCRVIRREIHAELFDVHVRQYRLTLLICQPKLTQQIAHTRMSRLPCDVWEVDVRGLWIEEYEGWLIHKQPISPDRLRLSKTGSSPITMTITSTNVTERSSRPPRSSNLSTTRRYTGDTLKPAADMARSGCFSEFEGVDRRDASSDP